MRKRDTRLGDIIREARLDRKITQRKFAETLGLNLVAYSGFENAMREPTEEMLAKVCEALELNIDEVRELNAQIEYIPFDFEQDLKDAFICRKHTIDGM